MKIQRILTVSTVLMALNTPLVQAEDVVLGVVGPATGQYAAFFDQITHGAKSVVETINANGGVNGDKLVLDIQDDACDPKQAVAVANKYAAQKTAAVIGHFCSSSAIPASEIYADAEIPMIASAASSPIITERGLQNVFRTSGRDDLSAVVAYEAIIKRKLGTRIAIINDKSTYGRGLAENVKAGITAAGLQVVVDDTLTQGEKDFSTLVSKLKLANVDLVFFGGYFAEGGLLVRQAREQGLKATFMGGDGMASTEFASIAGAAGDGFLFTFYPDPRNNPKAADIVKKFRDVGYEPEGYTLYTYAAIQAYASAANNAKSTDGSKVSKSLHTDSFNTVLGDMKFDKKGDPSTEPFIIYAWEGGKYKPLN
ncbi:Leucine-specific-binding protein [Pseudomonas fluorescens]|uniref:branched-chain amino acid ABC transporter substrate-binding protein n=1 Tax=Pseudomonas fluorescens TaxID=294 RepID=UPI001240793B|nr:branched-chain amino acid ABC transporter substrate-binding protein [Pseudomonas fluorescens]VVP73276.1 Leucine-specific-binding protein [Pseudomonas fluorescens]